MADDWRAAARELLARNFLFGQVDAVALDAMMSHARPVRYGAGEPLFFKGDPGDGLLALIEGRVRISTLSADGKEIALNIMAPGDVFGEIALLDGKERTADATAMEPALLVVLERRDFLPFLESHPRVCLQLIEILCGRLRWVSDLYEDAIFLTLPSRLAKRLLALADRFGAEDGGATVLDLKLSQQELGNMTGATREAVNKILRRWEQDGVIAIRRSALTILDRDILADLIELP